MKCKKCGTENKDTVKTCKKCGASLVAVEPIWRPTWKWHLRALLTIYLFLTVVYFAVSLLLSRAPEPYRLRERPKEITPWLNPVQPQPSK